MVSIKETTRALADTRVKVAASGNIEAIKQALMGIRSSRKALEIQPDEGEKLRGLSITIGRAASQLGLRIGQGRTEENTIVVWLTDEPTNKPENVAPISGPVLVATTATKGIKETPPLDPAEQVKVLTKARRENKVTRVRKPKKSQ